MRDPLLNALFSPAATLPGLGPRIAPRLDRLLGAGAEGARVVDLLLHLPTGVVDRSLRSSIAEAPIGQPVTLRVRIAEHRPPPANSRAPYRVLAEDATGDVTLVFFKADPRRMSAQLPAGEERFVSGTIELFDGRRQMVHPDRMADEAAFNRAPALEPTYPLVEGLSSRMVGRFAAEALARVPAVPEWLDASVIAERRLPGFADALASLHRPASLEAAAPNSPGRMRLAYDEMLAHQLSLALMRKRARDVPGRAFGGDGRLKRAILARLPFVPTDAQLRAVAAIEADLASRNRMLRMVQGDVGSGKTLVALLAMARVVEAGAQAALMAPTEVLARQHGERLAALAEGVGLRVAVLTGRDKGAGRARTLRAVASGEVNIVVGTHALFTEDVAFRDLGLAVVDEQHRFGVHQRLALSNKGAGSHVLVMTATPIPRTLVLTMFGDLDVSTLDSKPAGRQPIDTRVLSMERLDEVVAGVGRAVAAGGRCYWICPLVEESETVDASAAQDRAEDLHRVFGPKVGLLHGRMSSREKETALGRFQSGDTTILVATTVVEVGVDVPEANVMVIEHAERFGLTQLHQLRGRIGRGSARSTCLLLYKGPLGEVAEKRLAALRDTEDGFRLAELDLQLRGEGDILGTRQSGALEFRLVPPGLVAEVGGIARADARLILERDPQLRSERGRALRLLLGLFEREDAISLLRAG